MGTTMTRLQKYRLRAFRQQAGRCYYCDQPIWLDDAVSFASHHRLPANRVHPLRGTAGHLVARAMGGTDRSENIVVACFYCNRQRHMTLRPLKPDAYRLKIRRRLARGEWHGFHLLERRR